MTAPDIPVWLTEERLASMIDLTLLKATAVPADIEALCARARARGFGAACVNGCHVPLAARLLGGSPVRVACVVGFPLGAAAAAAKAAEAAEAVRAGAGELDMVANVGYILAGDDEAVRADVAAVVQAAGAAAAAAGRPAPLVKVILECCYLDDEGKVRGARAAAAVGAAYVKTSTGFGPGGATASDVALLKRAAGPRVKVKAAGGIRDLADALAMIAAGADRLGCSAGEAILDELSRALGQPRAPGQPQPRR